MRAVFVADKFSDSYIGGAELSIQTHIDSCRLPLVKVLSKEFNPSKFKPKKDFLIFGNYSDLNRAHFAAIADFKYVIEECDYKYCAYRSSHKHKAMALKPCDCHTNECGKQIVEFMKKARHIFWKSERQRGEYFRLFPDLGFQMGTVVGGVFSDEDIDFILSLRGTPRDEKYFVLYSGHWIKGHRDSVDYCRDHKLDYREVGNIAYRDSLKMMAKSKGVVYMPRGFDVSCRMITEAKLLGIEIVTNDLIQHMTEDWFDGTEEERLAFLRSRNKEFWRVVEDLAK